MNLLLNCKLNKDSKTTIIVSSIIISIAGLGILYFKKKNKTEEEVVPIIKPAIWEVGKMVVRKKTEGSEDLEDQQELIEINPNLKNVIQKEKDMMEIINIDKNGTAELLKNQRRLFS